MAHVRNNQVHFTIKMESMRQGQQQGRRGRNNNNNNRGGGGGGGTRKPQNTMSRNFESSGPDIKIRGTASHIAEKYSALARDAMASGDIIMAENYLQHAEHYNRIIMAAQAQAQASAVLNPDGTAGGLNGGGHSRYNQADGYFRDGRGDDGDDGDEQAADSLGSYQHTMPNFLQPRVNSHHSRPANSNPAQGDQPNFGHLQQQQPPQTQGVQQQPYYNGSSAGAAGASQLGGIEDRQPRRRRRRPPMDGTRPGYGRSGADPIRVNGNGASEGVSTEGNGPASGDVEADKANY
jgi:hypothetical protein